MLALRRSLIARLRRAARLEDVTLLEATAPIAAWLRDRTRAELAALLTTAGIIPEAFGHDSSEEKLYDQAMNALVAEALRRLGYQVQVGRQRGRATSVRATWVRQAPHTVVVEPRSVRLSRTALNPKDYKLAAMGAGRGRGPQAFAALIAPIVGFPLGTPGGPVSRVYRECGQHRVAALTYAHLSAVLAETTGAVSLRGLWSLADTLRGVAAGVADAPRYWRAVDQRVARVAKVPAARRAAMRRRAEDGVATVWRSERRHLAGRRQEIESLPRRTLVLLALQGARIAERLGAVGQRVARARGFLRELGQAA